MANKKRPAFTLPRGATGFFQPGDGALPETDQRAFRTALHAAARVAEGRVGDIEEQVYPRTFHTASVVHGTVDGENVILCHAHHPWIAFVMERRDWYTDAFLSPPPWAHSFTSAGFVVLSREQLATPLADVDASALSQAEWRQVRHHGVATLGGVLFNAWD
ncbi:hypothetical protein [Streptomyces sp. CBMA152]|uniref:hypothetical protein n=1 Tax=Streptomyces sp. CBMA152 TaxID=1896312 RepID=UPI002948B8FD|nr:hypothetical protein [Streptomyces sp. CBMA152]MBD0742794.1 hypothetical protein [Streptomyces sp. CBMA152]